MPVEDVHALEKMRDSLVHELSHDLEYHYEKLDKILHESALKKDVGEVNRLADPGHIDYAVAEKSPAEMNAYLRFLKKD